MTTPSLPQCGNALIDDGHRRLMAALASLGEIATRPQNRAETLVGLKGFLDLLRDHFGIEEIIMRSVGYAGAERHARIHTRLIDTLGEQVDRLEFGAAFPATEVVARMTDMLIEHELVTDSEYWTSLDAAERPDLPHPAPRPWDRSLDTGNARIDSHHRALSRLATRFHRLDGRADTGHLANLLHGLNTLMRLHFRTEETLWPESDPHHALAHSHFLETLDHAGRRLLEGEMSPSAFARDVLDHWLVDHIRAADQPRFRVLVP
ncbi:Hemerythrin [Rhodospirillum rubrum ATCC 11170]|uniref:Hemerythrin n=2 Tax=Rhodospirillum rubrum TaxID=1085 RepID=Q2RU72_RHORT|nr:hemerythrin family protein [Rhodospirillum rubrum]ABC22323.1 Hemerythrin [Rhodospirillum rubrum ATCC 11170]MBK5953903.1 hemerythrin [Rhodospirillum rubrum]QXG81963.1 hemerythrin family protein [Rhodospirillum rubrum]